MEHRRWQCQYCFVICPCKEALEQHEQECAEDQVNQDQSATSWNSSQLNLLKLPKKCAPNSVLGRILSSMNEARRRRFTLRNSPVMKKLREDYRRSLANQEAARKRQLKLEEKRRSRAPTKKIMRLTKQQQQDAELNVQDQRTFLDKIR